MKRPSWNEYFKEMVQVCVKRSACKRLQVGCLLVKENRIVAQGYNGYLPGCPHEQIMREGHEIATVHAEQNVITDCAKRGVSSNNSIAYITHYPCMNCFKVLCAAGIKKIYYINDYHNDEIVDYLAKIAKVEIIQI